MRQWAPLTTAGVVGLVLLLPVLIVPDIRAFSQDYLGHRFTVATVAVVAWFLVLGALLGKALLARPELYAVKTLDFKHGILPE
jgi:hypothetical protein